MEVLSSRLRLSLVPLQGEDGFPGFKGDMGIKGDRVSVGAGRGHRAASQDRAEASVEFLATSSGQLLPSF